MWRCTKTWHTLQILWMKVWCFDMQDLAISTWEVLRSWMPWWMAWIWKKCCCITFVKHQRQTSKNIIPQGWSNEGFTTFEDCPHRCVWANEEYIVWWSAILFHIHWRLLKENSCLFFEGQRSSFWKIQTIQGVGVLKTIRSEERLLIQLLIQKPEIT